MEQVLLIKVPTRLGVLAAGRIRAALSEGLALSVDVCAAVEIESAADGLETQREANMRQIHRDLPRKGRLGCPSGWGRYRRRLESELAGHMIRDFVTKSSGTR